MRRSAFTRRIPRPLAGLGLAIGLAVTVPAHAGAQTLADYDYDQLTFRGVGVGGGYFWSDRIENTEHYSLRFDLGYLGPGVRVIPSISYWSSGLESSEIEALADRLLIPPARLGRIEWSDVSLSLDSHFVWSTPLGFLTYLGLGPGLHALNGRGDAVAGTFVEDLLDDLTVGVTGIAGLELETGDRIRFFAEGRYTATTSLRYGGVRAGLQYMFSTGSVEVGAVPPPDLSTGRAP